MANGTFSRKFAGGRVGPEPGSFDNIVEIRPKRIIRIKHLNPKARDEKFEKEMQAYLQYRENAVIGLSLPIHLATQRQRSNLQLKAAGPSSLVKDGKTQPPNLVQDRQNENTNSVDDTRITTREPSDGMIKQAIGSAGKGRSVGSATQMCSPAMSQKSESVQSVSGVHVDVTRPSSLVIPLKEINEKKEPDGEEMNNPPSHFQGELESIPQSSRSSKKTKDHRPFSAKSLKHGPRSVASSDISDTAKPASELEMAVKSRKHLESSYKNVTLFFIHGVGGSADIWNSQIDFFANLGLEVIAPDLLGHGFSQSPDVQRMYHFNEILADMETIFDKYCKRQNIVIGHSYGCAFAAALGRRRSRRVTKLVLISGGAPIPLAPQPGVFSLPVCMLSCIQPCLYSRFERNAFHDTKQSGLSREQAFDVPVYVLSHMMIGQDWLDGDELYHQWLTAPTLLLHGKYDNFVTVKEEEAMEKSIHLAKLVVIDNASHMVMMEVPDVVNKVMYDFFFQESHESHEHDYEDMKSMVSSARSTKKLSKSLA